MMDLYEDSSAPLDRFHSSVKCKRPLIESSILADYLHLTEEVDLRTAHQAWALWLGLSWSLQPPSQQLLSTPAQWPLDCST